MFKLAIAVVFVASFYGVVVNCFFASQSQSHPQRNIHLKLQMKLDTKLAVQPTWNILNKKEEATVGDLISILGRFDKRQDFLEGN